MFARSGRVAGVYVARRTGTMRAMSEASHSKPKPGFFRRLRNKLTGGSGLIDSLSVTGRKFDAELKEELETELLMSDIGIDATEKILAGLGKRIGKAQIDDERAVRQALRDSIAEMLRGHARPLNIGREHRPFLMLVVGVNGSGKTTTIGKLARIFGEQGYRVMLAAGDTYRAAAIEQLQVWGERNDIPVIAQQPGADPAAVVYDALESARARGIDIVLADTAGRLQNQAGLMDELAKVVRVAGRLDPAAPHEKLLVLDASLGQNAVNQAVEFDAAIGLTGIAMTKLDSGGKGGVLISIAEKLDVPFRFIGVGEAIEDLDVFDADQFAGALVGLDY